MKLLKNRAYWIVVCLVATFIVAPGRAFAESSCNAAVSIKNINVKTLSKAKRFKLFDEYSAEVAQVQAIYDHATQVAARIPGVTIVAVSIGDVEIRRNEARTTNRPKWQVTYEGSGSVRFGVSTQRSPREEKVAELIFAKNELSWLKFLSDNSRLSRREHEGIDRRARFATDRIREISRRL